jgi:hypothetical protein
VNDHLKCYKVKDGQKFKSATIDFVTLFDPPFGPESGCVIKPGKAKKFCTPGTKTVTATDGPQVDAPGPPIANEFLCYKLKCPAKTGPDLNDRFDQFGARPLTKLKTAEICTPVSQGVPPSTTTTTTPTTTLP